ncbi:hypothetical protein TNCT_522191, partial [Trichonephila clavata]
MTSIEAICKLWRLSCEEENFEESDKHRDGDREMQEENGQTKDLKLLEL